MSKKIGKFQMSPVMKAITRVAGNPTIPHNDRVFANKKNSNDKPNFEDSLLAGQVANDGTQVKYGSKDYEKLYNEGSIAGVSVDKDGNVQPTFHLDEVVIRTNKEGERVDFDNMPYFDSLSEQAKDLIFDKTPIGAAIRRKAQTKKGLAEDALAIPGQLFTGALDTASVPQSLMVEGIEAIRGNPYNFANSLPGSTSRRLPSQVWGFEDKPGWDLGGSLNTAIDVLSDPVNLIGAGLVSKGLKIPNLITKVGSKNLVNPVLASKSSNFNLANKFNLKANIKLQSPDELSAFSYFNKKQREGIKKYVDVLSEGADVAKSARLQEIKNLSSPKGFERLVNQELDYLKTHAGGKGFYIKKGYAGDGIYGRQFIKPEDFNKYAISNARNRIAELKFPSVNEQLANIKSKGNFGFFNFNKAQDVLYTTANRYKSNPTNMPFTNNAFADTAGGGIRPGPLGSGADLIDYRFRIDKPKWTLGTGSLDNYGTAVHELGHVLQKNMPTAIDKSLQTSIKSKSPSLLKKLNMFGEENYFRTGDSNRITEAYTFGREYIQNLQSQGFLKNRYDKITPDIIKKSIFKSGGKFSSNLNNRIIGLMKNDPKQRTILSGILNKMPSVTLPILGGTTLKFSGDRN
jgi:hypothetical protein